LLRILGNFHRGRGFLVRLLRSLLVVLPLFIGAGPAAALPITLTLVPSAAVLTPGQTLSVDIVVSGLVDAEEAVIALESFDLDLAFDTSRLAYTSLAFGGSLGDPENAGQTFVSGPGNPNGTGVALLFEFSLLSEAQLLALQDASFTLATLEFQALAVPGDTVLQLVNLDAGSLGGVGGVSLSDTELAAPAAISVEIVPEPALVSLGAAALLVLRRRSRAQR
jgi:hypothetical protein